MKTSVVSFTTAQSTQELAANIVMNKINDFCTALESKPDSSVIDIRYISNAEPSPRSNTLYSITAFLRYSTAEEQEPGA